MNRKTSAAKRSLGRKAACLSITAALAISAFAGTSLLSTAANAVSAEEYGLADNIQDGVILHCWHTAGHGMDSESNYGPVSLQGILQFPYRILRLG